MENDFVLIDQEGDYRLVDEQVLLAWFTDAASWLSLLRLLVLNTPAVMTAYPEDQEAEQLKVILRQDVPPGDISFEHPLGRPQ